MNIIEAIKSGKRFRRKSWSSRTWIESDPEKNIYENRLDLPFEAIIADDWEVEEKFVTVTSADVIAAWNKAFHTKNLSNLECHVKSRFLNFLGLK